MVSEIINFIAKNHSEIISILALLISIINLIYLVITNKKKIDICINSYTKAIINDRYFYIFNIDFINKSRLPLALNEISIINNKEKISFFKTPKQIAERNTNRNSQVISHKELYSSKIPINLDGLTSNQCFLTMYGPKDFEKKISMQINSNRGIIKKEIELKDLQRSKEDFINETRDYCM